jgi:hypothetical protein
LQYPFIQFIFFGNNGVLAFAGNIVPAWDPRLAAMGMSKDEFERHAKSFRDVDEQGGITTAGIILATLGTLFCCICTIYVSHLEATLNPDPSCIIAFPYLFATFAKKTIANFFHPRDVLVRPVPLHEGVSNFDLSNCD